MLKLKDIKEKFYKNKLYKKNIELKKFCFEKFKTSIEVEKNSYVEFLIDSLDEKNEILLDKINLSINGKQVSNRNIKSTLYKNCKNCSNLNIVLYFTSLLPGDEITIEFISFNKKTRFSSLNLKYIYLHDNEFFLDFS